jgi:hypothetical protein
VKIPPAEVKLLARPDGIRAAKAQLPLSFRAIATTRVGCRADLRTG